MSERADNPAYTDSAGLSPEALHTYRKIIDGEPLSPGEPGLHELLDLHAVIPSTHTDDHYVPLDPQQAAHALLWKGFRDVSSTIDRLGRIPQITELLALEHQRGNWHNGTGSEYMEDMDSVNARIDKVMASATEELLTSQPRKRTEHLISQAMPRDAAALDRGASMRTLYPYSARVGIHEPLWMQQMSQKGAAVRTLAIPFPRMVIVDRRHAFIEDLVVDGSPEHAAWHVTDRAFVEWMVTIFDLYWDRADPWSDATIHSGRLTTPMQRAILRELVAGRDQKQIAPRLNISEKTIHNQLTDLRSKLGLSTTIQLVYWWATSPENTSAQELKPGETPPNFPG
ncbi:LuxR C-terminal-related transcriptional regulator (plasmid) [Streptomyces sp. NBC_01278]|uniref:helix-turn-helix transcriptional regulator n=1 Tax=Streptomyces sp. NBC_01278 TaxID=2903809 RepID=UPI002E364B4D|nr:LuxR C-terminal-related transcriptional regulator [Streptomyces sp. NBC_01278]